MNFTSSFGRLRQKIASKSVLHVQHVDFSSFSQSNHWFVALSLSLSSSFLKLKLRTDDGDGKEDRWEFTYLMSKNNVYCTRHTPRTCVSLHFDIYVWRRHLWNNRELQQRARTSSENVTSRLCNHFLIIQSHYAWKMCSNYPGFKLEPALGT